MGKQDYKTQLEPNRNGDVFLPVKEASMDLAEELISGIRRELCSNFGHRAKQLRERVAAYKAVQKEREAVIAADVTNLLQKASSQASTFEELASDNASCNPQGVSGIGAEVLKGKAAGAAIKGAAADLGMRLGSLQNEGLMRGVGPVDPTYDLSTDLLARLFGLINPERFLKILREIKELQAALKAIYENSDTGELPEEVEALFELSNYASEALESFKTIVDEKQPEDQHG